MEKYIDKTYIVYSGDKCFDIEYVIYEDDTALRDILQTLFDAGEKYILLYVCKRCKRVYFIVKHQLALESSGLQCSRCGKFFSAGDAVYQLRLGFAEGDDFIAAEDLSYWCQDCYRGIACT